MALLNAHLPLVIYIIGLCLLYGLTASIFSNVNKFSSVTNASDFDRTNINMVSAQSSARPYL